MVACTALYHLDTIMMIIASDTGSIWYDSESIVEMTVANCEVARSVYLDVLHRNQCIDVGFDGLTVGRSECDFDGDAINALTMAVYQYTVVLAHLGSTNAHIGYGQESTEGHRAFVEMGLIQESRTRGDEWRAEC